MSVFYFFCSIINSKLTVNPLGPVAPVFPFSPFWPGKPRDPNTHTHTNKVSFELELMTKHIKISKSGNQVLK